MKKMLSVLALGAVNGFKILGMLLGLCVLAGLALASAGEDAAQSAKPSAFELKMRILEGVQESAPVPPKPVTWSYLKFMNLSNFENEEDVQTEQMIKKVYNLKAVNLLTEATLVWMRSETADKAFQIFRLNGQEYAVFVTPGKVPARNQFRIEVYEQGADKKSNLLDTEFSLPDKTAAVFGFENTQMKPYFITLRVTRWVGEPAGGGPPTGGVVPGVLKSGEKVKPPKLVHEVAPIYPEIAKKAQVEGVVILEATADTYGRVSAIKVLRSIPLLDQAAIDALKQWVYEPMVIDGKPREVTFTVTVRFTLDKDKKPAGGVAGGVQGGVVTGVEGGVAGGVQGGVRGGVEGGVVGGVLGGVAGTQDLKQFEGDAVRAVGDIKPPKLVKEVVPVYPEEARKTGVEGVVILEAKADEYGKVIDARVLRSIPSLDQAAIEAVKQWIYEPLILDGKPRKILFTVTVRFALKEGGTAKAFEKFAQGAVKAEGDIKPPRLIKEAAPVYPETARQAGVEGVVILGIRADEEGKIVDAMVLRSIPLLDQAAIDAVRQWVYEPTVIDGTAKSIVFTVTVRFQLKENVVRPGDTLQIEVQGMPSLSQTSPVFADGQIHCVLAGDFVVVGRTVSEVREQIAQALTTYLKAPKVTVTRVLAGR